MVGIVCVNVACFLICTHSLKTGSCVCRVAAEEAPKKAERSLTFLLTILRHLASGLAKAPGESLLEANLLEASLQVLPSLKSRSCVGLYSRSSVMLSTGQICSGYLHTHAVPTCRSSKTFLPWMMASQRSRPEGSWAIRCARAAWHPFCCPSWSRWVRYGPALGPLHGIQILSEARTAP